MKVAFVHPDLGIGGAERLIVDAAIALQERGQQVTVFTSHHDKNHCFPECSNLNIKVAGDWLPRHISNKGHVVFAILRSIYLALYILTCSRFDIFIVDQVSAPIPLLKLSARVLFYCHFPDKLLAKREGLVKRIYRLPMDFLEEITTSKYNLRAEMADEIMVNSRFTREIFKSSFPLIWKNPSVLYPGIKFESYDHKVDLTDPGVKLMETPKQIILSINRFERKKNIQLAITAFAEFIVKNPQFLLVLTGGYDPRVEENVQYLLELISIAKSYNLSTQQISKDSPLQPTTNVAFLPSFTQPQRTYLLSKARMLLYTPSHEHFGIVPLEAMYAEVPVVAVNSGGPLETILDGKTGYLVESSEFSTAMQNIVENGKDMRKAARRHVMKSFSCDLFGTRLEDGCKRISEGRCGWEGSSTFALFWLMVIGALLFVSFA